MKLTSKTQLHRRINPTSNGTKGPLTRRIMRTISILTSLQRLSDRQIYIYYKFRHADISVGVEKRVTTKQKQPTKNIS